MAPNEETTGGTQHTAVQKVRYLSIIVIAVGLVPLFGLLRAGNRVSDLIYIGTLTTLVLTIVLLVAIAIEPRLILHSAAYRDYDDA